MPETIWTIIGIVVWFGAIVALGLYILKITCQTCIDKFKADIDEGYIDGYERKRRWENENSEEK